MRTVIVVSCWLNELKNKRVKHKRLEVFQICERRSWLSLWLAVPTRKDPNEKRSKREKIQTRKDPNEKRSKREKIQIRKDPTKRRCSQLKTVFSTNRQCSHDTRWCSFCRTKCYGPFGSFFAVRIAFLGCILGLHKVWLLLGGQEWGVR